MLMIKQIMSIFIFIALSKISRAAERQDIL